MIEFEITRHNFLHIQGEFELLADIKTHDSGQGISSIYSIYLQLKKEIDLKTPKSVLQERP